jgi:LAS superfamily LD-carboxypeptidase LdcB
MRPDAAAAWIAADAAAAAKGITMCLADGKRSRAQQQATYDDYVTQYGQAMADQYVLPPEKSAHVLGIAVDVQPYAAYTWLEGTKGALAFCRTYDNETWHFEYDPAFITGGCPARLPHPGA